MNQAIALVAAYLLGSIPFALIAGRLNGVDLRTVGAGDGELRRRAEFARTEQGGVARG